MILPPFNLYIILVYINVNKYPHTLTHTHTFFLSSFLYAKFRLKLCFCAYFFKILPVNVYKWGEKDINQEWSSLNSNKRTLSIIYKLFRYTSQQELVARPIFLFQHLQLAAIINHDTLVNIIFKELCCNSLCFLLTDNSPSLSSFP